MNARLEQFLGEAALPIGLIILTLIFARGLPFIIGSVANG